MKIQPFGHFRYLFFEFNNDHLPLYQLAALVIVFITSIVFFILIKHFSSVTHPYYQVNASKREISFMVHTRPKDVLQYYANNNHSYFSI